MMLKHFMPIVAGLVLAGVASAQESTTTPPTPPTPPVPPQVFRHMEIFTAGGGFLGVVPGDVTPENMGSLGLSEEYGVVLNDVLDNTPAKSAGLQKNDVIIGWNGTRVESAAQLRRLIHETPVGRSVKIDYIRGGSRQSADVKIGEQKMDTEAFGKLMEKLPKGMNFNFKDGEFPKDLELKLEKGEFPKGMIFKDGEGPVQFELKDGEGPMQFNFKDGEGPMQLEFKDGELPQGIGTTNGRVTVLAIFDAGRIGTELQTVSPQLAKYFGMSEGAGALVGSVKEKSAAAEAGIEAGDIITSIDEKPVASPNDVFMALNGLPEGNVMVSVLRDRQERTFTVKLPKQDETKFDGIGISNMKFRFRRGGCTPPAAPTAPAAPTPDTQRKSEEGAKLSQLGSQNN
jgi:membrane-associated protease RseP (regulator of RpoE activity)